MDPLKKILAVDDDEILLEALKIHLELQGYQVFTAGGAEEALELFKKEKFPTILMDINMPHKDGVSLLEEIKSIAQDTTVIMMTAYTSITKVLMSRLHGALDYILKPFGDLSEMDAALERAYKIQERWQAILEQTKEHKLELRKQV